MEFEARTGLLSDGSLRAGAIKEAFEDSRVDNRAFVETSEPLFKGTIDEFTDEMVRENQDRETYIREHLRNRVRKCSSCGKSCGFTMTHCNNCGDPLPTELSYSENVFTGFIYGIEKGSRFPYSIAIRKQTDRLIVFDDILAASACHFCAIPTTHWCPDWRMLLRDPKAGLDELEALDRAASECLAAQFLASPAWRAKFLRSEALPSDMQELAQKLRDMSLVGCNFPPSQWQLHVQYVVLPFLPHTYYGFCKGTSVVKGRWFPLSYIRDVLSNAQPWQVEIDTPMKDIIKHFEDRVSYEKAFQAELDKINAGQKLFANWAPGDFSFTIRDNKFVSGAEQAGGEGPQQVIENDKKVLHSFGSLKTYYKFAKKSTLPEFGRREGKM